MPKFKDAYQTTLGSRISTDKIQDAIAESLVRDNLLAVSLDLKNTGDVRPIFITSLHDSEENIKLFAHPYYFKSRDGTEILATDMRLYFKKRMFDGTLASLPSSILSLVEYNFTRSRVIFNLEWLEGDVQGLKNSYYFATAMFGRWIADILSRAYALDARDQIIIAIAASYYYQALFTDDTSFDEETLHKWQIHTTKCFNVEATLVKQVFSKMPKITGAESLVEAIRFSTENVRLKDLSIVSLLTNLKNSWYGNNSKEIIAVAVEHPPTWMAIVYAAMHDRSYRSTLVSKISERVGKRGVSEEYIQNCHKLIAEYSISENHRLLAAARLV